MMKLNVIFIIVNVMNYPSSLCLNFQTFRKKGMRFERFTQLTITQKQQKLIRALKKYLQEHKATETSTSLSTTSFAS